MLVSLVSTGAFIASACWAASVSNSTSNKVVQPVQATSPRVQQQTMADRFVEKAEAFFATGKNISPDDLNAYNFFKAAQILEPNHLGAKTGLDAILIAELSAVKDLLAQGKRSAARRWLKKIDALYQDNELVAALFEKLDKVAQPPPKINKKAPEDEKWIPLDEAALAEKSEAIVNQLSSLARELSETNEGVMIYARSDAQARWVYQQMRKAVPNHRIRGDLRIGKPAIKLLKPFD